MVVQGVIRNLWWSSLLSHDELEESIHQRSRGQRQSREGERQGGSSTLQLGRGWRVGKQRLRGLLAFSSFITV